MNTGQQGRSDPPDPAVGLVTRKLQVGVFIRTGRMDAEATEATEDLRERLEGPDRRSWRTIWRRLKKYCPKSRRHTGIAGRSTSTMLAAISFFDLPEKIPARSASKGVFRPCWRCGLEFFVPSACSAVVG